MKKSKPSQHGGVRDGAGRPTLGKEPLRKATVFLDEKTVDKARKIGDGSVSAGIRTAVKAHKRSV